jgi:hypothetical protein
MNLRKEIAKIFIDWNKFKITGDEAMVKIHELNKGVDLKYWVRSMLPDCDEECYLFRCNMCETTRIDNKCDRDFKPENQYDDAGERVYK